MRIDHRKLDKVNVLTFNGRLVLGDATHEMHKRFKDMLKEEERLFVFDMRPVDFMDSMGLGTTIACYHSARTHDAVLKLVLDGRTLDLISLTGLHKKFDIYNDLESALASFA